MPQDAVIVQRALEGTQLCQEQPKGPEGEQRGEEQIEDGGSVAPRRNAGGVLPVGTIDVVVHTQAPVGTGCHAPSLPRRHGNLRLM